MPVVFHLLNNYVLSHSVLISRTISLFLLVHSQADSHLERAAGCIHVTAQIWSGPGCRLFPKSLSNKPQ